MLLFETRSLPEPGPSLDPENLPKSNIIFMKQVAFIYFGIYMLVTTINEKRGILYSWILKQVRTGTWEGLAAEKVQGNMQLIIVEL